MKTIENEIHLLPNGVNTKTKTRYKLGDIIFLKRNSGNTSATNQVMSRDDMTQLSARLVIEIEGGGRGREGWGKG